MFFYDWRQDNVETARRLDDLITQIRQDYGHPELKVILLGTPNLGSVGALQEFLQGFKVGLRRIPTEVLLTFPGAYQLFFAGSFDTAV